MPNFDDTPVEEIAKGFTQPITDALRPMGENAAQAYGEGFEDEWLNQVNQLTDMLKASFVEFTQVAATAVEDIFMAIGAGDYSNLGKNLLEGFANFLSNLGKMMIAYGVMKLAFYEGLSLGPAGVAAVIAAGVAAVAIAGLIKGALSGAGSAMSGGSSGGSGGSRGAAVKTQPIEIFGTIKGKDIVLVTNRYSSDITTIT